MSPTDSAGQNSVQKCIEDKWIRCDQCPKKFTSKTRARHHIVLYHSNVKSYICRFCSASFKLKAKLWCHTRKKHSEEDFTKNISNDDYNNSCEVATNSSDKVADRFSQETTESNETNKSFENVDISCFGVDVTSNAVAMDVNTEADGNASETSDEDSDTSSEWEDSEDDDLDISMQQTNDCSTTNQSIFHNMDLLAVSDNSYKKMYVKVDLDEECADENCDIKKCYKTFYVDHNKKFFEIQI